MFRKMRRKTQELSFGECEAILNSCTSGVLAVSGDEGYPYAVPLSYVYSDNKIYFHCAKSGHKLDAVEKCSKASFCVIAKDDILPEKYTTLFKSVIVFGKIRVLKTAVEMEEPIKILTRKYVKNEEQDIMQEFLCAKENMYMLCLDIEHISGKQCRELVK